MIKNHASATLRNREPIRRVLAEELEPAGFLLEIAAGTGEHAVFLSREFPEWQWQPTDPDPAALSSIAAWREDEGAPNLLPPMRLDAASKSWDVDTADAVLCVNMHSTSCEVEKSAGYPRYDACVCINMVHISEWEATVGLFRGCAKHLAQDAPIILYGPYLEDSIETAPSNLAFDRSLKERNPAWGLRKVTDVDCVANDWGFRRSRRVQMPANNLTLVYRRKLA